MNQYLLDTNVVSETRKPRPHGAVMEWLSGMELGNTFLSAATLGELQVGIEKTRRQDPRKAEEIERWTDLLAATYAVLPMDASCFRECARIMYNRQPGLLQDAMIAATVRAHAAVLATRNLADFEDTGIQLVNPWTS